MYITTVLSQPNIIHHTDTGYPVFYRYENNTCTNLRTQVIIILTTIVWNNNKMAPTIYVCLQGQCRNIVFCIGHVPIRTIQDSSMSPDYHFSWHVLTKTELSSTQLALPIKCQKKYLKCNIHKRWWIRLNKKRNKTTKTLQVSC